MWKLLRLIFVCISIMVLLGATLSFVSYEHVLFEINTNFSLNYLLVLPLIVTGTAFLGFIRSRQYFILTIYSLVLIANLLSVELRENINTTKLRSGDKSISVLFANVYAMNQSLMKLDVELSKLDPDVLAISELSPRIVEEVRALKQYPHQIVHSRNSASGMGVYSKFPIREISGPQKNIVYKIDSLLTINDIQVFFTSAHLIPPVSNTALKINSKIYDEYFAQIKDENRPIIFGGDLNATKYSHFIADFINRSVLLKTSCPAPFEKTWNQNSRGFIFAIDHVFYGNGISERSSRSVDLPGSDHKGILTEFVLN